MEIGAEGVAAVSLFLANVIVIIVAIGTYWRMTRYEENNHVHIIKALLETREAGREMKAAARELLRAAERAGASGPGQGGSQGAFGAPLSAADLRALSELPQLVRQLLAVSDLAHERGDVPGEWGEGPEPLPPPERAQEMSQEQLEALKLSHRKEVERILAQRRRVQAELMEARERLEESSRLLNSFRTRAAQSLSDKAELKAVRERAERAESVAAKLQRDMDDLLRSSRTAAGRLAAPDAQTLRQMEQEAQAQREQLAEAARTIETLRAQLEALGADAPQQDEFRQSANEAAREQLEREIEKLNQRVEELEDSLRRNLVEKSFIEDHYLKEAQRPRDEAATGAAPVPPLTTDQERVEQR
ncbi:hypothetical protein QWZ02_16795 [Kinneretia asaccharophila]|uniref:Uncharacterized protein n=1 Tax=Roseateles asaccharophilus TaxID=582607 RepID=A0A4R6N7I6_9BURK|nr:hypothetical protein [Roseateles asaccharophilus]MDN3546117.1 hypothetical protein [Roseateles asaccharophilus]TDP11152.1 hypothetical protein DFR39_10375 [Roseateles asaccharophilus]